MKRSSEPVSLLLCLIAFGFGPALISQSGVSACPEIETTKTDELAKYVQAKYRLGSAPSVTLEDIETDCYYKLRFTSKTGFNLSLFLSPDRNHMFTAAFDIRVDPAAAEQAQNDRTRTALLKGAKAIDGNETATVKVVVYSDFQCPYCAAFWGLLRDLRSSRTGAQWALYYRSFPLDGAHPWARTASVIATCAQEQKRGTEHFLDLASFFFEEQAKLNSKTFNDMTMARLRQQPGFDEQAYTACMSSGRAEGQITEDVNSAQVVGVKAVPTIFINGSKIEGVPSPEQFKTILNQAIAAASSTSPGKPSSR